MHRRLVASVIVALSFAAGFHTSVTAAPPLYVRCMTPLEVLPVVDIVIANQGGRVRDAVHFCLNFWGGHPAGMDKVDLD